MWGAGVGRSLGKGNREHPSAAAGSPGGQQSGPSMAPVSKVFTGEREVFPLGRRGLRKERVQGGNVEGSSESSPLLLIHL